MSAEQRRGGRWKTLYLINTQERLQDSINKPWLKHWSAREKMHHLYNM